MAQEINEYFQDFSGGYNSRYAPNRIQPTESPSMQNVWWDTNALKQRNGASFVTINPGLSGTTLFFEGTNLYRTFLNSAETLFISGNVRSTVVGNFPTRPGARTLMYTTDGATFTRVTRNVAGTVTASSGGSTVTGSGTAFTSKVTIGDTIIIAGEANQVTVVTNDTSLTVDGTWGSTYTNVAYDVMPNIDDTYSPTFVTINSTLYVTSYNPAYKPFSWNGTTAAAVSGFPNASSGLVYKNYVFMSNLNGGTIAARMQWSGLLDATIWPASNFIDFIPNDGQGIVGMFLDGQGIVVLKTNSAFKVVGDTFDPQNVTYSVTPIFTPSDFQINSERSVQYFNGSWVMLGRFGLYTYDGSYTVTKMNQSDLVKSLMTNTGFSLGTLPPSSNFEPQSMIVDGKYWLVYPQTTGTNNGKRSMLVMDANGKMWYWLLSDNGALSDFQYLKNILYGVRNDLNTGVYTNIGFMTLNTGSTDINGVSVSGSWTSRVFHYTEQQGFLFAFLHYKKQTSGTVTFGYRFDDSSSFTTVSVDMTSGLGQGQRLKSAPILLGLVANTVQFQISDNNVGDDFEIYAIELQRRKQLL